MLPWCGAKDRTDHPCIASWHHRGVTTMLRQTLTHCHQQIPESRQAAQVNGR